MAKRVEGVEAIEAGALLPDTEVVPKSPAGDSDLPPRDEQGSVEVNGLSVPLLPADENRPAYRFGGRMIRRTAPE